MTHRPPAWLPPAPTVIAPAVIASVAPDRPARVGAPLWEVAVAAFMAVLFTTPGMLLLGVNDDPAAPENPIFRLWWPPIYLATLLLCARRLPRLARFGLPLALCALILGWAYVSKSWSLMPDVTSRRVTALGFTTLFGVYLGAALSERDLTRGLAAGFAIGAALSFFVCVLLPRYGLHHEGDVSGDWRGLWVHKNTLATWMVVGAMAGVCAALACPDRRRLWLGCAALCVLLLLLSRGKTALISLVVVLAGAGLLTLLRRGPAAAVATLWTATTGVLLAAGVAILAPTVIFKALGKDATLTGRTDIWAAVLRQWAQRPWRGYGFAAFWEKGSIPAQRVAKEAHWLVPSAHNGWLDLLIQLGAVGLALFVLALVLTAGAALVRFARHGDGYFSILFLAFFVITSLSESVLETHNSLYWVLFVAVMTRALGPSPQRLARLEAPKSEPRRPVFAGFAQPVR